MTGPESGSLGAQSPSEIEAHIIIRGRVQRVGYRVSLQRAAQTHGLRGWVRNSPDGSVEALLQGRPNAVHAVVDWAWSGPRGAAVSDVSVTERVPGSPIVGFEIRE